ncbi:MAG TPA: redoxin domain-containing protein [Pyrinomonadaceae bacterium]|jgi:thiol-disulfide isomerase/thioredoxin
MTRFIRLALLAACTLSLVSSFALRQSAALKKSQVPGSKSQVKEKGLETWNLGLETSQQTSTAPVVLEIDVAGLKKLLARDDKTKRPLLVNFWATWCEPCRAEFPDLVKIDGEYRRRGLDFIAVSIDDVSEIKTTVPQFLKEMRATMPAYLLNTPEPEAAIGYVDPQWRGSLPATFLYDAQGKVIFKQLGRIKPDELRAAIKTVLRDK